MRALERLRALDFCERGLDHELTKPPKPPFVSFVGTGDPASSDISRGESTSADPGTEHRRAKALAMLDASPKSRIALVAEDGDPVTVGVAIRGVAYGEIDISAASYQPFVLLAILDRYSEDPPVSVH